MFEFWIIIFPISAPFALTFYTHRPCIGIVALKDISLRKCFVQFTAERLYNRLLSLICKFLSICCYPKNSIPPVGIKDIFFCRSIVIYNSFTYYQEISVLSSTLYFFITSQWNFPSSSSSTMILVQLERSPVNSSMKYEIHRTEDVHMAIRFNNVVV